MQPQPQTAADNPTPPRGMDALPQAQPGMPHWRREQQVGHRDDTTRFLCAAAHLDAEFAENAIREFLVEPTRAVAPSPGIDAGQVLHQAVAARNRRKTRDGALCVLAPLSLVLLALSGEFTVPAVGILLGMLLGMIDLFVGQGGAPKVLTGFLGRTGMAQRRSLRLLLAVLGGAALVFALSHAMTELSTVGGSAWWLVAAVVVLWVMLIVLVVDEITVWRLVTNRFRSGDVPAGRWAAQPRNARPGEFAAGLARYQPDAGQQAGPEGTPVTVYRGYHPFVGAGREIEPWSMAIPLQRKENEDDDSDGQRTRLTTNVLYRSVREEVAKLKRATPLSPGRRLTELRILEQVVVPAEELVDHYLAGDQQATHYLPGLDGAPARFVSREQADVVAANAEEWARYYLCLQIETWDRDLVMSILIHFAMDDETLYIEWTPCVLLPIKPEYRRIDGWSPSLVTPVTQAISEWVTLPATILGRAARALSLLRPLPQDGVRVNPDRYGALHSLREMAADDDVQSYFQLLDIERYRKIVQSRFNLAVGRILDEHGYSSQLFRRQAATMITNMITNNNFSGGQFAGPIVTGGTTGAVGGGTFNSGDPDGK